MIKRIRKVQKAVVDENLDAFMVSSEYNLTYLTGYTGSNGLLLIYKNQKPIFYTDFRYEEQIKHEVKGCQIKILNRNLIEEFPPDDIKDVKILGFEASSLTYRNYLSLANQLKNNVQLVAKENIVEKLRMIKDDDELSLIRHAARYTDEIFNYILSLIKPGVTEKDLSSEINYQLMKKGWLAFPAIVAFGKNSAMPHARPTVAKLKKNDVIVFDLGLRFQNYCSDMTRTVVWGKASKKVKEIYKIVLEAQSAAISLIKDGVQAKIVDQEARRIIEKYGYGKFFGHGLGHGVGIVVHELPILSSRSIDVLRINQVVTVEPGIYLPDEFGIRIEDLIVIKKNNCEILTKSTKELIEL
jgi:Xaa-Pro aminopeptidase